MIRKWLPRLAMITLCLWAIAACADKTPHAAPAAAGTLTPIQTPAQEPSVSELLADVQAKYCVEVLYNGELQPFDGVAVYTVKDEELMRDFLLLLDAQLERYPRDFFKEAKKRDHAFRFFASDQIISLRTEDFDVYNGYYNDQPEGYTSIAIDVNMLRDEEWPDVQTPSGSIIEYVLHHEIGHAMTDYLFVHMDEYPFDLSQWYDKHMPKDFLYYDMQTLKERKAMTLFEYGARYVSEGSVWFPDIYAQKGLQEHLASLFAYAMMPDPPAEWKSPNVQKQVAYYFPMLRQAFSTTLWPEATAWEQSIMQDAIHFPDANLERRIREQIGKPTGSIFPAEVESIETLDLIHLGSDKERITELTGLEHFTSLKELNLSGHRINNASALTALTKLQSLDLSENGLEDVRALEGLTALTDLRLYKNRLTDISALSKLTGLQYIDLGENTYLSDIPVVNNFRELTGIGLALTNVTDISPLGGLRRLSSLPMTDQTPVWDFSPLTGGLDTLIENRNKELEGYTTAELENLAKDIRELHAKNLEAGRLVRETLEKLIKPDTTELEKELAIFNFVAERIEYDFQGFNGGSDFYNALVIGKGVCQHYALAFRVLCNAAGLECYIVRGDADNGSGAADHVWNIVKIDGVYYQVDVTWADGAAINYDYFNRSTAAMNALGARTSERPENDKACLRDMTEKEVRALVPGYVRDAAA